MELVTKFIKLRNLMLMVVLTTMSLFVVSCGGSDDDDVATVDAASVIASSYSGTLKPIGFSDAPAACYVTLTRLSSKTIRLDRLLCEKFDVDMDPVNLTIVDNGNGRYTLESETSKSIGGTYYQGQLTLTYQNRLGVTFSFTGSKDWLVIK